MSELPNFHRTKIIATVGPSSNDKEIIKKLIHGGVNVFRLNFSHGSHEGKAKVIAIINEINKEWGTNVGILADLQGPKIRLGEVENGKVELIAGSSITLTTIEQVGTSSVLSIRYDNFISDVEVDDRILIDDGKIELKITGFKSADEAFAEVVYGGVVKSRKGANLPRTHISTPSLTHKDIEDLEFIFTQNVNWIALSFVRSPEDVIKLKGMIQFKNHAARVIAKIEKPEAVEQIDGIIKVADAIMIARGDLGVEMPLQELPVIQKMLVKKCNQASRPVIIATQMMESMINSPFPTRAEVTDVSNAIFEGADAVMLSGETAVGKYPVEVVKTFSKVIQIIEKENSIYNKDFVPDKESPLYIAEVTAYNACKFAEQIEARRHYRHDQIGAYGAYACGQAAQSQYFYFYGKHRTAQYRKFNMGGSRIAVQKICKYGRKHT